jgi:hypothetical protein
MKRHAAAMVLGVCALAGSNVAGARTDVNVSIGLPGLAVAPPPPVVYLPPGYYAPPPPVVYNGYYGPGWNRPYYHQPYRRPSPPPMRPPHRPPPRPHPQPPPRPRPQPR